MSTKPFCRPLARLPVRAAALLVLSAPFLAMPHRAWAEDAEPVESGLPANSIAYSDSNRVVKISLPKAFKSNTEFDDPGKLGSWLGPLLPGEDQNTAMCALIVNSNFRRAKLAFSSTNVDGEVMPESIREGPGFHESCWKEKRNPFVWRRHVEKNGTLYTVLFVSGNSDYATVSPVVRAYLDSFEVTGEPRPDKLPDGWKEKSGKDLVMWSKVDDKKSLDELSKTLVDVGTMLDKVLKGKPWNEQPARVKMYDSFNEFTDACDADVGNRPDHAGFSARCDAVYANYLGKDRNEWPGEAYSSMAVMRIQRYFGGSTPEWLRSGLMRYAVYGVIHCGGKPNKPNDHLISLGRGAAKDAHRFDHWFEPSSWSAPAAAQASGDEVWAWMWFLLHGKAPKDARKAFEDYLSVLRDTGDLNAAQKAWEGVDFDGMLASFKGWAEKWK
jgi:hypothetical protein